MTTVTGSGLLVTGAVMSGRPLQPWTFQMIASALARAANELLRYGWEFSLQAAPILDECEDRPFELEPDGGSLFVHEGTSCVVLRDVLWH
jgi:hypothetical protein